MQILVLIMEERASFVLFDDYNVVQNRIDMIGEMEGMSFDTINERDIPKGVSVDDLREDAHLFRKVYKQVVNAR